MPARARAAAVLALSAVALAAAAAGAAAAAAAAKPRDRREACGRGGAGRRGDEVPPPLRRKVLLARLEEVLRQTARAFRGGGGGGAFLRVPPDLAKAVIRHFAWLYRTVILRAAERLLAAARSAWRVAPQSRLTPRRERELKHESSRRRGLDTTVRGLRINESPRNVGPEYFGPFREGEDETEDEDDDDEDDDDEPPELAPIRDEEVFGAEDAAELPAERLSPAVKQAFGTVNGSPGRNSAAPEMT